MKLWEKVYREIRRDKIILLDSDTLKKVYRMLREETGMNVDDINVFIMQVVSIAASDIIADIVLDKEWYNEVFGR